MQYIQRSEDGDGSLATGVTDGCEPFIVGVLGIATMSSKEQAVVSMTEPALHHYQSYPGPSYVFSFLELYVPQTIPDTDPHRTALVICLHQIAAHLPNDFGVPIHKRRVLRSLKKSLE